MWVLVLVLALGLCSLGGGLATPDPHGLLVEWSGSSWDRTSTTTSKGTLDQVKTYIPDEDAPHNFRDILVIGDSLMIAARNKVVNVSLQTYTENKRIHWEAESTSSAVCRAQYSEEECQNYIRVLAEQDNGELFVCGTHANNPRCRVYASRQKGYEQMDDRGGLGISPRASVHNNTAVFTEGRIFAAGFTDAQGTDPLIYSDLSPKAIRTEQHDSQWLNDPNFVDSFEHEDKVYFLFHENAVEHINCGKARFSRIARVCKNDKGGIRVLRHTWTSFFKSRLNCSIPGEYPFYFDQIMASSSLGEGNYRPSILSSEKDHMFYAIFSTLPNSIPGMAVCAFRMEDVIKAFEGQFKEQTEAYFNWLPATKDLPKVHPAKSCANNSHNISDSDQAFIKKHPLMDKAVPAFGGQPILVSAGFNYRFTAIAVDWRVQSTKDKFYDVIFLGTNDGRVLKAVNRGWPSRINTIIIEDMKVFEDGSPVVKLHVHHSTTGSRHLVVVSESSVKAVPLERCNTKHTCSACVALQDPYCSWTEEAGCSTVPTSDSIQSVDKGQHPSCQRDLTSGSTAHEPTPTQSPTESKPPPCDCTPPVGGHKGPSSAPTSAATTTERRLVLESAEVTEASPGQLDNRLPPMHPQSEPCMEATYSQSGGVYSVSQMAAAVVTSIMMSLLLGAVIGHVITRLWANRQTDSEPFSGKDFSSNSKMQNAYEVDSSFHSAERPAPLEKNFVCNQLKDNGRRPNGSADNRLTTKSTKVYV